MFLKLLDVTSNSEELIEYIARICYDSEVKGETERKAFLKGVIKSGHTSVIEHAKATFEVDCVSRALTHQLVRHRLASYTQQSQRYVNASNFGYVTPDSIKNNSDVESLYNKIMADIQDFYKYAVENGIKKEDARFLLPNACHTKIVFSMNFRELRTFIELRSDSHAQWEIRELSDQVLDIMYGIAPTIFGDLYEKYIGEPRAAEALKENGTGN